MKDLFNRIEEWMDKNQDGWSSKDRVGALVGIITALRPQTVVEIGIWAGKSLVPMAMAMQELHVKGRIVGIDPWEKNASCDGLEGEHLKWWGDVNHETIYKKFVNELIAHGLMPYVEIHRCRSDEFHLENTPSIQLLHVDGNHGENASLYDINNFAPLVSDGGFLFMDDVEWARKAADIIPSMGFKQLYALDGGFMYQRINHENPK